MPRKIWIISFFLICSVVSGNCQDAIKKCDLLVQAQDADIKRLHEQVKELEGKLESEGSGHIPFYVWAGAGFIAGGLGALWIQKH